MEYIDIEVLKRAIENAKDTEEALIRLRAAAQRSADAFHALKSSLEQPGREVLGPSRLGMGESVLGRLDLQEVSRGDIKVLLTFDVPARPKRTAQWKTRVYGPSRG